MSQWCPYCRGFTVRTAYNGPNSVLNIEVSLYRTASNGPNSVLNIEVSLYRTAYNGPKGVLNIGFTVQDSLQWSQWCP